MSLNRAQLIGNLTRDPEVKQIPGGSQVATFGLATNFVWTDQSGNKQNKAEYHNIVAWRKLAEICGQFLKKGSKVYVEGRIQTREWEAEDGSKRYRTEIVADNMIMLDKKGEFGESFQREPAGIKESSSGSSVSSSESVPAGEVSVDDLPF